MQEYYKGHLQGMYPVLMPMALQGLLYEEVREVLMSFDCTCICQVNSFFWANTLWLIAGC